MRHHSIFVLTYLGIPILLTAGGELPPPAEIKIDFSDHVRPILAEKCHSCHGQKQQQAGLRLDRRQPALRGGDYGPVIVQGNSAESKLIKRLVDGDGGIQMPPTGPLSAEEIGILRAWIDQGADFGKVDITSTDAPREVDPKVRELIAAIRRQNGDRVKSLVKTSPDLVNGQDAGGSTPLHHAAAFGTLESMKFLIVNGADVNARNDLESTPLHWAVQQTDRLKILLDAGAEINAQTENGKAAVFLAAASRFDIAPLKFLLDKGADPNLPTRNGATPLIAAAAGGDIRAIKLLMGHGADPNTSAGSGMSPLMAAANGGHLHAVKLLLELGADVNAHTKRDQTALGFAAAKGAEDVVRVLLEAGATVNEQDSRGYSPLMYAAYSEAMPAGVVSLLLEKGAKTDVTGEGETPLSLAGKRGDNEVARLLGVREAVRKSAGIAPLPARRGERTPSAAVEKAVALLEMQSPTFVKTGGCNSCHNQTLPAAAVALANQRGIPAPKQLTQIPLEVLERGPERSMIMNVIGPGSVGFEMFGYSETRRPADEYTDSLFHYLKAVQYPDGHWPANGNRPPLAFDDFIATAMGARALADYAPATELADTSKRLERAARWLEAAVPSSTQERTFQLLGLAWAKADPLAIKRAAAALAATQRHDGGWSQLPTMGSDAYATGEALYALHLAGKMDPADEVYRKGVKYLLRAQASDGSWHVKTRSLPFQPYFESGFPYGEDQWISAAGTSWAAMALAFTVEPAKMTRR